MDAETYKLHQLCYSLQEEIDIIKKKNEDLQDTLDKHRIRLDTFEVLIKQLDRRTDPHEE